MGKLLNFSVKEEGREQGNNPREVISLDLGRKKIPSDLQQLNCNRTKDNRNSARFVNSEDVHPFSEV
jgi:hypothetical protein